MPISLWRRLNTPAKQLIILIALLILLIAFLIPLSKMVSGRVQECLDNELLRQGLALRTQFGNEIFYLREEAQLLGEIESVRDLASDHDGTQLRHLMALYQNTHDSDGIFLITDTGEVYTSSPSPPLDEETVRELNLVKMGFSGQSFGEMITVDGRIWLAAGAPHLTPEGTIDSVFLILKEVDPDYLESLMGGLDEMIVITDGDVKMQSHMGQTPDAILDSFSEALQSSANAILQPYSFRIDGSQYRAIALPLTTSHSHAYAIALVKNADIVNETMWATLRWGALFGVIGIVIALILVQFHVVEIFRPLRALVDSTQRIAEGELDVALEPSGVADVYELATNFEIMRQRLQELLERERALSENLEVEVIEKSEALEEMCRSREQLLAQLISSQEEERRRVSRELHDETSQELANLIVRLGTLARITKDDEILAQLQALRAQAVRTLEGVNRIVMDLRPGLLDEFGLAPAIQWYANARLESQGVQVAIQVTGMPRELSPHTQASIYRMVQEAINNIAQHAHANRAEIRLDWQDDKLRIEVEDNGRGLDIEEAKRADGGHFGLLGIRERVALLNGVMDIESAPGQGTRLIIEIPYYLNIARRDD